MRGYYAIIGDKPYELPKLSLTKSSQILGEEKDHTEVESRPDTKSLTVKVTVSNLTRETWTNKSLANMFKEFLRKEKVTQITKLSEYYTVYIQYELWDDVCGECVDCGIGMKEARPEVFQFPLGLNEENEYVARLGFSLPVSITQRYKPKHPYGMMRPSAVMPAYSLVIKRIWVTQLMERAWSLRPDHCHTKPHHHYYGNQHCGHDHRPPHNATYETTPWGRPYQMHDPDCGIKPTNCHAPLQHPSANDVTKVPADRMFETADFVEEFQTVPITFTPETVTIKFTAKTLSPILINREEIEDLLGDIKQEIIEADAKPPVTPPDTDSPDTPLDGDDKDQQPPKKDPDDKDTDDSGSEDGDDNSDGSDPIDGDDKDIGEGKEPEGNSDGSEENKEGNESTNTQPTDEEKTEE